MNHDYAHCLDYKADKCPKSCFRAQLTEELKQNIDRVDFMVLWANFKGTQYCELDSTEPTTWTERTDK